MGSRRATDTIQFTGVELADGLIPFPDLKSEMWGTQFRDCGQKIAASAAVQLSVEGFEVEAGAAGADGEEDAAELSLDFEASLDSAGFESLEDSEDESELLEA